MRDRIIQDNFHLVRLIIVKVDKEAVIAMYSDYADEVFVFAKNTSEIKMK